MATIEKDVALPPERANHGAIRRVLRAMSPGDSAPMAEFNPKSVKARITEIARETGCKFTTRTTEAGMRVWRTS